MNFFKLSAIIAVVAVMQGCVSLVTAPVKVAYGVGKIAVKGTVAVADAMYESDDERLEKEYKEMRKKEIAEQKKAEEQAKKQKELDEKAAKQAKKDAEKTKKQAEKEAKKLEND